MKHDSSAWRPHSFSWFFIVRASASSAFPRRAMSRALPSFFNFSSSGLDKLTCGMSRNARMKESAANEALRMKTIRNPARYPDTTAACRRFAASLGSRLLPGSKESVPMKFKIEAACSGRLRSCWIADAESEVFAAR